MTCLSSTEIIWNFSWAPLTCQLPKRKQQAAFGCFVLCWRWLGSQHGHKDEATLLFEHVQVLFAHQTPAVTLSFVSWKPGLSQGWAGQVRQNKESVWLKWWDAREGEARKAGWSLETLVLSCQCYCKWSYYHIPLMFSSCQERKGKEQLGFAAGIPCIPAPVSTFFCREVGKSAHGPERRDRENPSQAWSGNFSSSPEWTEVTCPHSKCPVSIGRKGQGPQWSCNVLSLLRYDRDRCEKL